MLDAMNALNRKSLEKYGDPEIATRINQYEMAFRMQTSVPELVEPERRDARNLRPVRRALHAARHLSHSAILARRLVERGVRAVQVLHRGWDQHGNLPVQMGNQAKDRRKRPPRSSKTLKRRGLLDDVLVVWGGEFGRTVYSQAN